MKWFARYSNLTKTMTNKLSVQPDIGNTKRCLRLLSYNIQVGIGSTHPRHYVTQSWKHVLPHSKSFDNLDRIAKLLSSYDVVGLQETDAGSLRTGFINQTEYLADKSDFPFWYDQTNRKLGKMAQHSIGFLSKIKPVDVLEHKLPGLIPGRGAMIVRYGRTDNPLILILIHLALGKRARLSQLDYISEIVNQFEHVVVMGDMNCKPGSSEMDWLFRKTKLREPLEELHTFPSWRPMRNIDHILVTPTLTVKGMHVLNHSISDHLPIAMEIELPKGVHILG